jgi:6-phosphogluconolactonase (cycloisomerase 2 family)
VWASNAASSNITAYTMGASGALTPLGSVLKQAASGPTIFPPIVPATAFPIDLALTEDSKFLYVVYSALGQIIGYKTGSNGQLTQVTAVNAYAPQVGVEGLAVY